MVAGLIIGAAAGFCGGIVLSAWFQAAREKDDAAHGYTILANKLYELKEYKIGGNRDV